MADSKGCASTMSSEKPAITSGVLCWQEIPVSDLPRAQAFYSTLLDWETKGSPMMPATRDYGVKGISFFSSSNKNTNGAFVLVDDAEKIAKDAALISVVNYYYVKDLDESMKVVEKEGGKITLPKTDIPEGSGGGSFCQFVDTEGNKMGLYSDGKV